MHEHDWRDVMLDLETMGTCPDAAVLSIAAVPFNPASGHAGPGFKVNVTRSSNREAHRVFEWYTQRWWESQPQEAKDALESPPPIPLGDALSAFTDWLRATCGAGVRVWGNSSAFDNVILVSAYKSVGKSAPWSFRNDRCYRTLAALFPEVKRIQMGTKHDALHDAVTQAHHTIRIFREKINGVE